MYETLLLIKPGKHFSMEQMQSLVQATVASSAAELVRQRESIRLQATNAFIEIDFNDAPHVREESAELAEECDIPCAECTSRYEINGKDAEQVFSGVVATIITKLADSGVFYIFDQVEGEFITMD